VQPPGGGPTPPPTGGTATIQATVVDAGNVGTIVPGALVAVVGTALNALSDAQGNLVLNDVPEGGVTLDVSFPSTATYQGMQLTVDTAANAVTQVRIAVVGAAAALPNSVVLTPADETVDVGGQVLFRADVRAFGVPVNLMPSLSLIGDIGTLLPSGLFLASQIGTGEVTAHVEAQTDTSTVEVVAPRPPRLGVLSVSPASLPADGGAVRIAISAADGDGIQSVSAEVEQPSRAVAGLLLVLETGTAFDGSWGGTYFAAPNNNPPDPSGVQLDQRYSVRAVVVDNRGAVAQSQWVDFTVAGLQAPPGPP
jgi:hypothetical protein